MYDVVVIGGGPGGYAAAIRVSQLGGKAALIEAADIGGACVNCGCIPTKIWHRAAHLLHGIRTGGDFGVKASLEALDLTALRARKNGVAGDIRMGMESLLANNGVELIRGRAALASPRQVSVDGKSVEAGKIILATGAHPDIPDIPGLEEALLTTNQALELAEPPASLLVWGAGPLEVEFATFFHLFGTQVCLAASETRLLPKEDAETSQRITQSLRELGVDIRTRQTLQSISSAKGAFEALLSGSPEEPLMVNRVLVAGRRPNTQGMGLEQAGIRLKEDGAVQVDGRLETSAKQIFALGDCTGGWMLSHAASAMAVTAAENAMGRAREFPFHRVPRSIWTFPEVGAVGLSEEEAEKAGYETETGSFPYAINGLAMARGEMNGAVKVVFEPRYGEILGVHIVGGGATELAGEAALAMQLECTVNELANSIHAHPTFSESITDAAREALDWALYLPKR